MLDVSLRTPYLIEDERERLVSRWLEPHRRYHDLDHLSTVLSALDTLRSAGTMFDDEAVTLAAWFHDAIYEIGAPDNEERSAVLAEKMLTGRPCATEVARLVRATADHNITLADLNASALCDADLSILASDPPQYSKYCADVRDEYSRFEDSLYCAGRRQILERLLLHERLFHTEFGHKNWELRARRNLEAELQALQPAEDRR
ncbi:hypothetical protein IA539_18465 [Gordonia sp. zg691]|uniref:Metal-dependent phosphohydrolase n=1 Tax=Gordonia jinghuaiqii TaxID=2758710 RepID=A0A7D7QXR4_9ACTN|nr:hypothetical protein [Gordonia jinghuaiqii]MBD0863166.1 hypothetical protein [Gordonia jinghuaiqii]MCR5980326.1 hypothetical protein [Gordonia jinghuaiqii]QMT01929.1 hypothetical protein H1R19_01660 [Gordonia jinghuaiqii]